MPRSELKQIFLEDRPLIDVRAPVEFARGAFPNAVNLPVLNDAERHQVGSCYKNEGSEAAIKLGHSLVSGETRAARITAWAEYLGQNPAAMLYCFRGGQRSRIVCQWLAGEGLRVPRVAGGYKVLRGFLLEQFQALPPLLLVSGRTGAGKTAFLEHFDRKLDLEGLAKHRGSAFGRLIEPQPSQIDFENALAIALLRLGAQPSSQPPVLIEDEARLIGRIQLPPPLQEQMQAAPLLVIEASLAQRTRHIFAEYIVTQWQHYQAEFSEAAFEAFASYLLTAVDAIRKRLGNVSHQAIRAMVEAALSRQRRHADLALHQRWIAALLRRYYDPMYDYQLARKTSRVIYRGNRVEVRQWYQDRLNNPRPTPPCFNPPG